MYRQTGNRHQKGATQMPKWNFVATGQVGLLIPESTGDASVAGVPVQIGLYGAACAAVAASNESVEQEGKAAGQTEQDSDRVADPRGRSPEEDA